VVEPVARELLEDVDDRVSHFTLAVSAYPAANGGLD
jgi:hypothetical protein